MRILGPIICLFLMILVIMLGHINRSIGHQTNIYLCVEMAKVGERCPMRRDDETPQSTTQTIPGEMS